MSTISPFKDALRKLKPSSGDFALIICCVILFPLLFAFVAFLNHPMPIDEVFSYFIADFFLVGSIVSFLAIIASMFAVANFLMAATIGQGVTYTSVDNETKKVYSPWAGLAGSILSAITAITILLRLYFEVSRL